MINQELLRTTALTIEMKNMRKKINSKAVFNQRDTKTAMLLCELRMDNEPIDLTGCTISAEILKSDGKTVIQKGQIVDELNGVIAIGLTNQCLSSIGETSCEIVIQHDGQILYSPKISYIVVDNLFDTTEIESTNEFPILNILIRDVQVLEQELANLDSMVNRNEESRQSKEATREENERLRQASIESMKENADKAVQSIENKIVEVNSVIEESNSTTLSNTEKVNAKIEEVNSKIVEINETINTLTSDIDNKMMEVDNKIKAKISEVDKKISEINSTITTLTNKVDSKILEMANSVDEKLDEVDGLISVKLNEVDKSLSAKLIEITNQVNTKIGQVDTKISEVNTKLSDIERTKTDLISDINTTKSSLASDINMTKSSLISDVNNTKSDLTSSVNAKINLVDNKLTNYDDKISEINTLTGNVENAERLRNEAEVSREQTFNNIVAELEVTQSDIDDILGMIGGL